MMDTYNLIAHFPDEILIEIFLKLSVRPLFLYRSVCKKWLHLIESPDFIRLHINRPIGSYIDHNPMLILRTLYSVSEPITSKHELTLLSDDETLPYEIDIPLDFITPLFASEGMQRGVHLLGPCNGLFCITDTIDVVMFNPATRQCRQLPRSTLSPVGCRDYNWRSTCLFECVAFGFDSISNDYKVVRFDFDNDPHTNNLDDDDYYLYHYHHHHHHHHYYKVEIFSLSTDCWRELGRVGPADKMSTYPTYNLFFNDAFHWRSGSACKTYSILVFNLSEEAFKQFEFPTIHEELNGYEEYVHLSVLNKSLAVIVHRVVYHTTHTDEKFEIWVMREYGLNESWSNLYNVDATIDIDRPLSFGMDGELFLEDMEGQLVSIDFRAMEMKKSLVGHVRPTVVSMTIYAFRYKESLISLKRC